MDRARILPRIHAEPGGMITDFSKKKRTSNQEGGPRVLRGELLVIHPLPVVGGCAADISSFFSLNGVVGDGPRVQHSISTSRRAGRDDYRFFKKKRTSNQEGGPPVLRGGLLIIHPLPNVAGSAADRSTFFLLNDVVGDGPRAHSNSTSRRAGRDNYRFFTKKKRSSNQEGGPRVLRSGLLVFTSCRMWLAAPRIYQLSYC